MKREEGERERNELSVLAAFFFLSFERVRCKHMVFVKLTADNLVKKRGEKAPDLFHSSFFSLRMMKGERISWVSVHLVIHHISLFFFFSSYLNSDISFIIIAICAFSFFSMMKLE